MYQQPKLTRPIPPGPQSREDGHGTGLFTCWLNTPPPGQAHPCHNSSILTGQEGPGRQDSVKLHTREHLESPRWVLLLEVSLQGKWRQRDKLET